MGWIFGGLLFFVETFSTRRGDGKKYQAGDQISGRFLSCLFFVLQIRLASNARLTSSHLRGVFIVMLFLSFLPFSRKSWMAIRTLSNTMPRRCVNAERMPTLKSTSYSRNSAAVTFSFSIDLYYFFKKNSAFKTIITHIPYSKIFLWKKNFFEIFLKFFWNFFFEFFKNFLLKIKNSSLFIPLQSEKEINHGKDPRRKILRRKTCMILHFRLCRRSCGGSFEK